MRSFIVPLLAHWSSFEFRIRYSRCRTAYVVMYSNIFLNVVSWFGWLRPICSLWTFPILIRFGCFIKLFRSGVWFRQILSNMENVKLTNKQNSKCYVKATMCRKSFVQKLLLHLNLCNVYAVQILTMPKLICIILATSISYCSGHIHWLHFHQLFYRKWRHLVKRQLVLPLLKQNKTAIPS